MAGLSAWFLEDHGGERDADEMKDANSEMLPCKSVQWMGVSSAGGQENVQCEMSSAVTGVEVLSGAISPHILLRSSTASHATYYEG